MFSFSHFHCATVKGNSFVDYQCRFDEILVLTHKSCHQNVFFRQKFLSKGVYFAKLTVVNELLL